MPQKLGPRDGNPGCLNEMRHPAVKGCGLQLEAKEIGVVRKESGIEIGLDGAEVDAIVLRAGVVAHDRKTNHGKHQDERQIEQGIVSPQPCQLRIITFSLNSSSH